ncbi:MAG: ABC transporter ATP-binding protein [Candidatus Heimdallarchaeota archaeon]|nr:ABC transporter ATP-binding protein [Candidatus Heimdallarchaeota archaeon]MCG3257307.1 ABC transporter ATP-binding protein [Candidatus Heimdallarchaeota archaeon]MCK4612364.1 ABC transporter ATP-binding protein [Candidatus Heimdallarchaeota archaeon]
MNKKEQIIKVLDLVHVYKGKVETIALPGVNLSIKKGERVVVRGKSGIGKSTLLHCLAGILRPTAGKILVEFKDIVEYNEDQLADYRCKTIGLIYQSYNLAPFLTVKENIEFPMVLAKIEKEKREKRINELVEMLEIDRYLKQKPSYLSGGEQQRVAIAVALANNPPIVLADEPTGNIDSEISTVVYELLSNMCIAHNTTLVMASHDSEASKYADREIVLAKIKSQEL